MELSFIRRIAIKQQYLDVDFNTFISLKKELTTKGLLQLRLRGKSMFPLFLNEGELIEVRAFTNKNELKRFDLLVYWQKDRLVVHYLWSINKIFNESAVNPTLITRPLNPIQGFDHPVKLDQVLGLVKTKKINIFLKIKIYSIAFFTQRN